MGTGWREILLFFPPVLHHHFIPQHTFPIFIMIKQAVFAIIYITVTHDCFGQKARSEGYGNGLNFRIVEEKTTRFNTETKITKPDAIEKERVLESNFMSPEKKVEHANINSVKKNLVKIDFLTIPLKFRPEQDNIPPQLNANMNGAVFVGFRTSKNLIGYISNPNGSCSLGVNYLGFSAGLFTGLGNAPISPTTTSDILEQEYDGIVWNKGIAGIIAINSLKVGLALGYGSLLDQNHEIWAYQNQPWLGLALSLNLD